MASFVFLALAPCLAQDVIISVFSNCNAGTAASNTYKVSMNKCTTGKMLGLIDFAIDVAPCSVGVAGCAAGDAYKGLIYVGASSCAGTPGTTVAAPADTCKAATISGQNAGVKVSATGTAAQDCTSGTCPAEESLGAIQSSRDNSGPAMLEP